MRKAFTPLQIGQCRLKNRFVMTACNLGWCENGYVSGRVVDFYRMRAKGKTGLIIAGAAGVDPVRINTAGMMQVCHDRYIPGLRSLAFAVHNQDSRIFLQLMHAGAYARKKEHAGAQALAPSGGLSRFTGEYAREMTLEEIRLCTEYFADAAERARKAGFDGVELIGSAGYLIAEFLSAATNRRQDAYGGSLENRCRFLREIIHKIRSRCGEYPVILRLSGSDFTEGGNTPEEFLLLARMLESEVDAFNITGGWHESTVPQITYNVPRGMYLYLAKL